MPEALHPLEPQRIPDRQAAEIGGAYRQMADAVREMITSDEGIQLAGLAGGALLGAGVAIGLEGMPIHPAQETAKNHYQGMPDKGNPPMVHANTEQFATISGLTLLGWAAGAIYTRFRHRREQMAEQLEHQHSTEYRGPDW